MGRNWGGEKRWIQWRSGGRATRPRGLRRQRSGRLDGDYVSGCRGNKEGEEETPPLAPRRRRRLTVLLPLFHLLAAGLLVLFALLHRACSVRQGSASNLLSMPVLSSVMLDSLDRPGVSAVVCASAVASSDNTPRMLFPVVLLPKR